MSQQYAALLIDLKKSRSFSKEDRNNIQHRIIHTIHVLNEIYRNSIIREVDFSAGDEIQGLFKYPEAAYLYYRLFTMFLHPIKVRAGIGFGAWDVQIQNEGTTAQDGQTYHYARHAINHTDDIEGYPVLFFSNTQSDYAINTIIGAEASITSKQSIYQNHLMLTAELLFPIHSSRTCPYRYHSPDEIAYLLHEKAGFDHHHDRRATSLPLDQINNSMIELSYPINVFDGPVSGSFYVINGKQRGIPTKLSSILDISRQGVEKSLKSGNVYSARNMAISALHLMFSFSNN